MNDAFPIRVSEDPSTEGVPAGVASRTLENAVNNLVRRYGFTVVVAAGNARGSNRRRDACRFSPGRVPSVITVGATGRSDMTWPDGMTGPCVDLYAPGEAVNGASVDGVGASGDATRFTRGVSAGHGGTAHCLHTKQARRMSFISDTRRRCLHVRHPRALSPCAAECVYFSNLIILL